MKDVLWLLGVVSITQGVTAQISLLESGPRTVRPSDTLTLTCKVSGASLTDSSNIYAVPWILSSEWGGLKWLGVIWYNGNLNYAQSLQGRITITRDTNKGEVYFTLTGVKPQESGTYYCVRYGSGYYYFDIWGPGTLVTVTSDKNSAGILLPLIPCCDLLKEKEKTTIGCLLKEALPLPDKIEWSEGLAKDSKLMKLNQHHLMSSFLTVTNSEWEKKPLTCSTKDTQREIKVPGCTGTVKIPHIEIFLSPFDGIEENRHLVCYVSDFTPKQIQVNWLKNGEEHASKLSIFKVLKGEDGLFSGTIRLTVSKQSWISGDKYTCKVDMKGETVMQNISKCSENFVTPVVNLELPSNEDLMHDNGRVICSVLGTNLDTYQIFVNFDDQNSNAIKEHTSNSLSVKYSRNVSQESWKSVTTVSCVAQSPCSLVSIKESKTVDHTALDNKRPSIEILASCKNWTQATLYCLVSHYRPHYISVAWFKNGKLLTDSGKDFAAMLNKKDNTFFGTSEISVNWNESDIYTCKATHQGQETLQNVTKCSACKNIIEEPVVELKLPSNEDLQSGNAKIICLIRASNLDNRQVSLKLNNEMKTPQIIPAKNAYTATYMVPQNELKGIKNVTCAVTRTCSPIPVEISKGVDIIIEPRFPDILTSFGNSNMATGTISLFCIISNYWPQNAKLVWLKNGNKLDNKEIEFTSMKQENAMYSGNSLLNVSIESWDRDIYSCQVTQQKKTVTQVLEKPQVPDGDIVKPSFRDLFLYKNATVSCRTNMVHSEIQWIENGNPKRTEVKNKQIIFRNTTWIQNTMTISLAHWENILSLSCKLNPFQEHLQKRMTIIRTKNEMKVPAIHLLPPDLETMMDDLLMLICLVMDFYPEDLFITWGINGSSAEEEVSNSVQVNCNHNTKQCSAISQLKIQKHEWLKGMTYSCLVAHISSEVYIMKNISAVPNKSEPFITPEPSFNDLLYSKNATVSCRTSVGINDINWLLNETEIPTLSQKNDGLINKDVESVQVTIQIPLEEWKTSSTQQFCKQEFFNITNPNVIKQPKVSLFPPTNQRVEEDHLTLICLVNGFYPENVFVTWKINDTTIKQDFPHPKDVICDHQKYLCSYLSELLILKEQWLGGMSYACLVAHLSSEPYIHSNISKPNDINTVYQDDGGEELQELEEINSVWTTTSTFITLFLVTLIYSSFVTFVKVK
ncbi:uncharacterized protein [Phyllobates terribilis]|uniref:uncharacterized protein isoform X1 n=1 Tax=Phyllobates terribilis TaxID=111132 RepID=UPI003CCA9537